MSHSRIAEVHHPDRRTQLIEAAIAVIARHGLSRTTLERVTGAAGLSPGIVSFYFKSKDAMLLAVLQFLSDEYSGAMRAAMNAAGDDALSALHRIIDVQFDPHIASPGRVAVWSAFWGETQAREEYTEVCGAQEAAFYADIEQLFQQLAVRDPNPVVDTGAVALAFEGLLDGLWQEILVDGNAFDRQRARDVCRRYLASIFPGTDKRATPIGQETRVSGTPTLRRTLPPWTYRDTEFLALEIETLFRRNWQLVGHSNEISEPGEYLTFDGFGERALVIRGNDGALRAFHNLCRHRGSRLVSGDRGCCKRALTCPFHGWTYGLDGALMSVPRPDSFGGLDLEANGLVPIDLDVWSGLVFIRFAGDGPGVGDTLAPAVAGELRPYRIEAMVPLFERQTEVQPVNWKLIHDIDNESYHVPAGHPGLHSLFGGMDRADGALAQAGNVSYATIQDKPSRYWSARMYQKLLPRFEHLPEHAQRRWFYMALFPNHSFGFYPDQMEYFQTLPLDPGRTMYVYRAFALPDSRREVRAARYLNGRLNRRVGFEDTSFVRWIGESMTSSAWRAPILSAHESGVSAFHAKIQSCLPVASLADAPAPAAMLCVNQTLQGVCP